MVGIFEKDTNFGSNKRTARIAGILYLIVVITGIVSLGYIPNLILGARQVNNGISKYIADKTLKLIVSENT